VPTHCLADGCSCCLVGLQGHKSSRSDALHVHASFLEGTGLTPKSQVSSSPLRLCPRLLAGPVVARLHFCLSARAIRLSALIEP
jgi:hypothetical protein